MDFVQEPDGRDAVLVGAGLGYFLEESLPLLGRPLGFDGGGPYVGRQKEAQQGIGEGPARRQGVNAVHSDKALGLGI